MRPLGRVKIKWSPEFAYAIGLLVTDGSLSKDGRHICLTSKDKELIENFQKCLKINLHVGRKASGSVKEKKYFVIQIGDVNFYKFLLSIGLMPNKTKIIGKVDIPEKYFFDFLRGHFDGDGSTYSYFDPRWRSSYMIYTSFLSASSSHIMWLQRLIKKNLKINGHVTACTSVYQLRYAKLESIKLFKRLYRKTNVYLSRKKEKIDKALKINIINKARVVKLVNTPF